MQSSSSLSTDSRHQSSPLAVSAVCLLALLLLLVLPQAASAMNLSPAAGSPVEGNGSVRHLASADFDEDGNSDLALASGSLPSFGIRVRISSGDGTFTSGTTLDSALGYYAVTTGDFNDDDHVDIFGYPFGGVPGTFLGDGDGGFSAKIDLTDPVVVARPNSIAVGDISGDDVDDIAFGGSSSRFVFAVSNGDGTFDTGPIAAVPDAPTDAADRLSSAAIGDFNGDGANEVAFGLECDIGCTDPGVGIWVMSLDPVDGPVPAAGNPFQLGAPSGAIDSLAAADFNDDGYDDLAASSIATSGIIKAGSIQIWNGDQASMLIPDPSATITSERAPGRVLSNDFDNDGVPDLAWLERFLANGSGYFNGAAIALGDGAGSFTAAAGSPFSFGSGYLSFWELADGDFNGDGFPELSSAVLFPGTRTQGAAALIAEPGVLAAPASIDFGKREVGTTSADQTVSLSNPDSPDAEVTGIELQGAAAGDFSLSATDGCIDGLATGASCDFFVSFSPSEEYEREAKVQVTYAGSSDPIEIALAGFGQITDSSVWPASFRFGEVKIGTTSETQEVEVAVLRNGPLQLGQLALSGPDAGQFQLVDDQCSDLLLANEIDEPRVCTVGVAMSPDAAGSPEASLDIPSNEPGGTESVQLTGTAIDPGITVSPSGVDFGTVAMGGSARTLAVRIESSGSTNLSTRETTVAGADAADFSIEPSADCSFYGLSPGQWCESRITFTPTTRSGADRSAELLVESNATDEATVIPLSGTAKMPAPRAGMTLKGASAVKAGGKLRLKVIIGNSGPFPIKGLTLRTRVPKKLAPTPRKVRIGSVPAGGRASRTIAVKVRKSANRGSKLRVKVGASVGSRRVASARRVVRIR